MAVITIRGQGQAEAGFKATLVIQGNNYQITFSDPFKAREEQELEWYFEQWLHYPILEQVKAARAAASVKQYGQELFKQVFQADINAYSKYSQLRGDLSQVQIEIESITPEFHAIHWEALQDPDLPFPLAIDSVLIMNEERFPLTPDDKDKSPLAPLNKGGNEDNRETSLGSRLTENGGKLLTLLRIYFILDMMPKPIHYNRLSMR